MNYKYLPNMVYKLYTIHLIASSLIKMSIFDLGKSSMLYEPQLVLKHRMLQVCCFFQFEPVLISEYSCSS